MIKVNRTIKAYIRSSIPNRESSDVILKLLEDYLNGNLGGTVSSENVTYDNTDSGLVADNVKDAIDELAQGSAPASKYIKLFNSTTDWIDNGTDYEVIIPFATHGKGVNPATQVFERIASIDYKLSTSILVDTQGNTKVQVTKQPDNRFSGKLIIQ